MAKINARAGKRIFRYRLRLCTATTRQLGEPIGYRAVDYRWFATHIVGEPCHTATTPSLPRSLCAVARKDFLMIGAVSVPIQT